MSKNNPDIAIIGCGAITEHIHLPQLARRKDCRVVALVERNKTQAEKLANDFDIPHALSDYRDLEDIEIDAAVIALPNDLHAPVSIFMLNSGIHVLVEKPMALSVADCDSMIEAAAANNAILAIGLTRRFSRAGQYAKWVIENGLLGKIHSFDIQDGFVFAWDIRSDFALNKEKAGGGVLMDLGTHALDQLFWWLGKEESFEYYDDSYGGVEADCRLELTLKSGAKGIVELSRTRNLRASTIIRGEHAELEVALITNEISLRIPGCEIELAGHTIIENQPDSTDQRTSDLIALEHDDFLEAIRTGRPPIGSGMEAKNSIALIEACYAKRRPLNLPWIKPKSFSSIEELE